MKVFLVFVGLLAVALAWEPITLDYHKEIGIPLADRIRRAEEARDFDGARIIGGTPASLGDYPYLGGLIVHLPGHQSVCGSSLVTNTKLVTAAHCWSSVSVTATHFTVVLASLLLFSGGIRIDTNRVEMHPNYDFWTENDIAVITIDPVSFSNNVRPIGLASGNNDYVGTWANAAGFGRTSDAQSGIPTSTFLSHVSLRVISNAECRSVYGPLVIIDSTICTSGEGGRNICGGDSGGPLSIGPPSSSTLIGVVSFGSGHGCERDQPGAYARVSSFESWIRARL